MKHMEVWSKCQLIESILFHCTKRNFIDMQNLAPGEVIKYKSRPQGSSRLQNLGVTRGDVGAWNWLMHYFPKPPHIMSVQYCWVLNTLHSTDAIPRQYWSYPPTVLMLSPKVPNSLCSTDASPCSTDAIPSQYWIASIVLNSLCSTEPTLYRV